jgi:HK97 family phage prohead protease
METNLKQEFGERVVTLSTNQPGLRGGMAVDIKLPTETDLKDLPIIDFVASDNTLDRYNEVIEAGGWKLENYKKNPVFQNSHQYGDLIFTLGQALTTEVRDGKLYQRVLFAVGINPMAKIAYELYKAKFLRAVSVGFIPLKWENGSATAGYRRKFIEQELLENSGVSVPANPNALALGLKSGAIEKSDVRELLQLLKHFSADPASTTPYTRALGDGTYEAQTALPLIRDLARAMRG